jgi:hypothetical protein
MTPITNKFINSVWEYLNALLILIQSFELRANVQASGIAAIRLSDCYCYQVYII